MRTTVLMSLFAVAGLSSAVFAEPYRYESRLVLDNDPLLKKIGVDYGTRALLPAPGATGIGITLLVRVTSEGTLPNYGLSTVGGGGSPSAGNARFTHDDAVSNETTALWTSPSLVFSRGYIDATSSQRGLMNAGVNFRRSLETLPATAQEAINAPRENFTNERNGGQPLDTLTNGPGGSYPVKGVTPIEKGEVGAAVASRGTYASGGIANANGWIGPIGGPETPGQIAGFAATALGLKATGGVNYAKKDQDETTPGVQGPWQAVYHLNFHPRLVSVNDPGAGEAMEKKPGKDDAAGEERALMSSGAGKARRVTVSVVAYARAAVTERFGYSGNGVTTSQNHPQKIESAITISVPAIERDK